jgi:hypothetical protein
MPSRSEPAKRKQKTSEFLDLYDELTAPNTCNAFVMQALAAALTTGTGLDERAATGAVFCAQWLNDRTVELEKRLGRILLRVRGSDGTGGS